MVITVREHDYNERKVQEQVSCLHYNQLFLQAYTYRLSHLRSYQVTGIMLPFLHKFFHGCLPFRLHHSIFCYFVLISVNICIYVCTDLLTLYC